MMHNWTYKKLGEVVKCYRGLTYSKADEVPSSSKMVLRSNNIDLDTHALNFDDIKCVREDLPIAEDRKLKKDSIFICMSNGSMQHLGKVAYVDKDYDYAFGGFMGLIVPDPKEVFPKYVYYSLLAPNFLATILREGRGANINNLRFTDLENYSLPLPTYEEQQAIVRELDGINRLIDLQEEQLREYDRLAQSLFYTTFGDPATNPKGWEIKKMGEVCDVKGRIGFRGYTRNDFVDSEKEGAISLSPTNIVNNHMDYTKCAYVTWDKYNESPEIMVQVGDILLVKTGSSYGKCAFVDYLPHESTINPQFVVIKNHKISSRYLTAYLQCDAARIKYDEFVLGTAIPTFSQKSLNSMPVPIPPLALQQTFAAQIETIEQQKALIRRSLDETRTLLAARMQYYFE